MSSPTEMDICSVVSDISMVEQILNSEFNYVEFYAEHV